MPHHSSHAPLDHPSIGKDEARVSDYLLTSRVTPARQASGETAHGRRHAVVLDGDPNLLEILGELLGDEGYDVTLSTRLPETDALRHLAPDVIIVDATFSLAREGQWPLDAPFRGEDGRTIPVIYNTTEPEVAASMADRGVPILLKPFDLDALLALLG